MDTTTLILAVLAATMIGVTWHARRLGNERRDVALLGVFAGLLTAGTAASLAI